MNNLFKKIKGYISASAWLQPLLIVIVIFVLLFVLNPIATGVKEVYDCAASSNTLKTISYEKYIDLVKNSKEDTKYIFVFTADSCENCKIMNPLMTKYVKAMNKQEAKDWEIYSINLTTKTKDDVKYYKDKTLGIADYSSSDYAKLLDERLSDWNDVMGTGLIDVKETTGAGIYTYVGTPLIMWYVGGIEVQISNNLPSNITGSDSYSDFYSFMKFPETVDIDEWKLHTFDLTSKGANN